MIGIAFVLLCTLIFAAYQYEKLVRANGNLRKLAQRKEEAEEQLLKLHSDQVEANHTLAKTNEKIQ